MDFAELESIEGLRWPWNAWPPSQSNATALVVPLNVMCSPLTPLTDLPLLPYTPLFCASCRGALNPCARVDYRSALWFCPFCFHKNTFPRSYAGIGPVSRSPPPSSNVGSAWGPRKEVRSDPPPSLQNQPVWSASRLAQASAVEKVSSGRWHLKSPEVETIRPHEREELERRLGETVRTVDGIDRDRERENPKSASSAVVYAEVKERTLPGSYPVRVHNQRRARSPMYREVNEKQTAGYLIEGVRPASSDGMFTWSKVHEEEVLERPKLKFLPRRKPLESPDIQIRDFDDKQFAGSIKNQYYNQSQYDEVRSEWSEFVYSYVGA